MQELVNSDGGKVLLKHIADESKDGWNAFIDLPAEKKTSKAAYDAQALYKVLRNLQDWIDSEIKIGKR